MRFLIGQKKMMSEGREFFLYSDYMGSAELFEDTDKEAETLSVNTKIRM